MATAASNRQHSAMSTPPPNQPIAGFAQAQANNSNNTRGSFTDDLHRLVDDLARGTLEAALSRPTSSPDRSSSSSNRSTPNHAGLQWLWNEIGASEVNLASSPLAACDTSLPAAPEMGVLASCLTPTRPLGRALSVPLYAALWSGGVDSGITPGTAMFPPVKGLVPQATLLQDPISPNSETT